MADQSADFYSCRDRPVPTLSSAVQDYIVAIARLRVDGAPVPLSQLAAELGNSPVSVNEMCRKLEEQGLVVYQPYKGVRLTDEGNRHGDYILRRHRLWEVFLVEYLGLSLDEAHASSCLLEHATSDALAARLDRFLGHPLMSPEGQPIPQPGEGIPRMALMPLDTLGLGACGLIHHLGVSEGVAANLRAEGMGPGSTVCVTGTTPSGLFLRGATEMAITHELARQIWVEPSATSREEAPERPSTPDAVALAVVEPGQSAEVLGVTGRGPVRQRLLDMGFSPGAQVRVLRTAPLGDPIEMVVRGYHVSLRRSEAETVLVRLPSDGGQPPPGSR